MANEKNTSRPDEPLQQRSVEEAQSITPTGGPLKVSDNDAGESVVTQQYHNPGTAKQDDTDNQSSRDYEAETAEVAEQNTLAQDREAARPTVIATSSPEVNYYTRDNIVYPDARPGQVAYVEAVAEHQLGVGQDQDVADFASVAVDPTDAAVLAVRRGEKPSTDNLTPSAKDRKSAEKTVEATAAA